MEETAGGTPGTIGAWLVHAYTALGLPLAAGIAVLVIDGSPESLRLALLLMAAATFVDATDGWMARKLDVSRRIPGFDGRRLDDIIDFHTYVSLPLLFIWRADFLPGETAWLLLLPLLASGYGFSRTHAKTRDGYFLGFPSLWNVVALYFFFLVPGTATATATVVILSLLTFVPTRYLNPSRRDPLNAVTLPLGATWAVLVILLLVGWVEGAGWILASLAFPAWYMAASWAVSLRDLARDRREVSSLP